MISMPWRHIDKYNFNIVWRPGSIQAIETPGSKMKRN